MLGRIFDRLLLVSFGVALPLGGVLAYLVVSYHRDLSTGRWPIDAFRYAPGPGFELTPGLATRLLDGSYFVHVHRLGFRIPERADANEVASGGVLSLGCSFTFGDEVEAEDTFAQRTATGLGLPAYNFGVPAYSLASIIRQLKGLRERRVLEKLAPRFVILGVGDWLLERSLNPFVPSEDMQYAYAYVGESGVGSRESGVSPRLAVLDPPAWASIERRFEFRARYFPEAKRDVPLTAARAWLLANELPRVLRANFAGGRLRRTLNEKLPFPSARLYEFVLGEVEKNVDEGATLVVLALSVNPARPIDPGLVAAVRRHPRFLLVDGARALRDANVPPEAYCCGRHPQPAAHEAYATAVVRALAQAGVHAER
jgi:hypothetical protein